MSNYGRLSEGLKLYRDAMRPILARRLRAIQPQWFEMCVVTVVTPAQADSLRRDLQRAEGADIIGKGKAGPENVLDIQHFSRVISGNWDRAFKATFKDKKVLNWIREVGDERNTWAHPPEGDLNTADANRVLDSCARVLDFVDKKASARLKELRDGKDVTEPALAEEPASAPPPAPAAPPGKAQAPAPKATMTGLRSWRDVVAPHPDVQAGGYVKAEFAAHLGEVVRGKASTEYGEPKEFYRRTFVTKDMRRLLVGVVQRLRGDGADPVLDLRTAFGGGKTHTLIAVYHLVTSQDKLRGNDDVQGIFGEAGGPPPKTAVAALIGTDLDPIAPSRLPEETGGAEINTLWGEMAYQLAGIQGYKLVQDHDARGVAPGADVLEKLFELAGPSVVLIDELVAYLRNVPSGTRKDTPSGNYGAHITFCQNLTEAAKKASNVAVLASIPETKLEYGDERGAQMAAQITNVFQRIGPAWQPVGGHEAFEVVRRRLFGEIKDEAARDQTCEAFHRLYRDGNDFPAECREPAYLERMRNSYPIHPEIFERLYVDWAGNIDRFQRTRGVLRLMADVIHRLWVSKDADPMILPGSLPLYDSNVRQQLVGYLDDNWAQPLDTDIDGELCEAILIERGNQLFGQLQSCRRLTRTIFLGSVPGKQHVGLETTRVLLGVVQPNEGINVYGDALRILSGRLSFLYGSDQRYWFEIRPNLNRVAADRIARVTREDAYEDLRHRLREMKDTGDFVAVHRAPATPGDVSDEPATRLVILGPEAPHKVDNETSDAIKIAESILDSRGNAPRTYRNMLVLLAPDAEVITSAGEEAKRFIGWHSIASDGKAGTIALDRGQQTQAESSRDEAGRAVEARMYDAYKWLLVPEQAGTEPIHWNVSSVIGASLASMGSLAQRASQKLVADGLLIPQWSPLLLKRELDEWIWKDGKPHVGLKQVWSYLATYLYFSRLRDVDVLRDAVKNGVRTRDYFGYADGVEGERYLGLVFGEPGRSIDVNDVSVLVRPEVAGAQVPEREPEAPPTPEPEGPGPEPEPAGKAQPTRFYATAKLNPARMGSSAGQIGDEIVQHLNALVGADVDITIEIQAKVGDGIPDEVVRTVTENARTLKFDQFGFEEE